MSLAHLLARFREAVTDAKHVPSPPEAKRAQLHAAPPPAPKARAPAWQPPPPPRKAEPDEATRRRIRDRYLAVRFPGAPHTDQDLRDSAGVIKSARLYFEDDDVERACELLEFAADANPADEATWLAHLEILFLKRHATPFTRLAVRFHERFPASARWPEILRLGIRLAPEEAVFHGARPREAAIDEHYGAWPQVQNWIQAPFDLTGDVLAAEFHAKMRGGRDVSAPITAKASGT